MLQRLLGRFLRHSLEEFELGVLPPGCEETRFGWFFGATRQWRGPNGLHVREHHGRLIAHYDRVDPRESLLGHLILDMRRELAFGMSASAGLAGFVSSGAATALLWSSVAILGAFAVTAVARARH